MTQKGSFAEWVTRPRQIFILFAITLAVAAVSASHKIHRCHAAKAARGLHKQSFEMKYHKVVGLIDKSLEVGNLQEKILTKRDSDNVITAKDATKINQIADEYLYKEGEGEIEDDMAEELGMQQEGREDEEQEPVPSLPQKSQKPERVDIQERHTRIEDNRSKAQKLNAQVEEKKMDSVATNDVASSLEKLDQELHRAKEDAVLSESHPKKSKHHKHHKFGGTFCAAIHRDEEGQCSQHSTPESLHTYFKGDFGGELILTSPSLREKTVLAVSSPGKARKTKLTDITPHVLDLLPSHDTVFGKNFSRCAVIGSSGILLKYEHGKEIDTHDMVLRFNSAKTRGFEKHVGAKTTHRLTNSRNFGFRESKSEHVLVHLRTPGAMKALVQRLNHKNKSVLYGLNPQWYSYMDKNLKFLSTSGLNGILMALHRCEHVRLYGFHVHPRHGVPYHYYNVKDKPANVGRDDSEWLVVKHLIEKKFVELGEPCILECNQDESECQKCIKSNQ